MSEEGGWRLPPLRPGAAASAELERRRAAVAGSHADRTAARREIGGVPCQIVGDRSARATLLYFHGGGYRMGTPEAWLAFAATLAEATGARIVLPDYALAPERPFPAALHDAVAVYRALHAAGAAPFLAGDSAGGGLAAALALVAQRASAPAAGAILLSPMLDLAAADETYVTRQASDRLFSRAAVLDCAALYLQGHAVDDPLASPLHSDPAAFPPTLLLAGGAEVLLGESLAFARKLALADRRVTLHVAPGMGHVWPMLASDTREAADAIAVIACFVRSANAGAAA